jgi:hypothetical protein
MIKNMKGYTISERLKMTIGNIEYQQKKGLWDDEDLTLLEYEIEKLKEVLERVQEIEKQNNKINKAVVEFIINQKN